MSAFADTPTREDFEQFKFLYEPTGRVECPLRFVDLDIEQGWANLLYVLCGAIKDYLETVEDEDFLKHFHVLRVKQKFGGLRFYVSRSDKVIYNMISEAEAASWEICEVCGQYGVPRPLAWITTLCHKHYLQKVWGLRWSHPYFKDWLVLMWDALINKNGGKKNELHSS